MAASSLPLGATAPVSASLVALKPKPLAMLSNCFTVFLASFSTAAAPSAPSRIPTTLLNALDTFGTTSRASPTSSSVRSPSMSLSASLIVAVCFLRSVPVALLLAFSSASFWSSFSSLLFTFCWTGFILSRSFSSSSLSVSSSSCCSLIPPALPSLAACDLVRALARSFCSVLISSALSFIAVSTAFLAAFSLSASA